VRVTPADARAGSDQPRVAVLETEAWLDMHGGATGHGGGDGDGGGVARGVAPPGCGAAQTRAHWDPASLTS